VNESRCLVQAGAREQDKILGKIRDLDGLTHFENEDLSTLADGESLQNQLSCLGMVIKIASHFRE